jgi:hypothetical protein
VIHAENDHDDTWDIFEHALGHLGAWP